MTITKRSWILLASALAVTTLTSLAPGQAARPVGERLGSPLGSPFGQVEGYQQLLGVSAAAPKGAFAVGKFGVENRALTQQWDGGSWSKRRHSAGLLSVLKGVDALSPSDAWAVGWSTMHDGGTGVHTLTEHWDGHRWRIVDSGTGYEEKELLAVGMVAPNDVWAVGAYHVDESPPQNLIKHWDGSTWTTVDAPSPDYSYLQGVAAISADDVWATGETQMLHWDGTAWSQVAAPSYDIYSLSAVSSDDVWAVGGSSNPAIEHWDGQSWSVVDDPDVGEDGGRLTSVSAVSVDDIWAAGMTYQASRPGAAGRALIEHWDGHRWRIVRCPHPGPLFDGLTAVSADSARDAWAVGTHGTDLADRTGKIMFFHWDGAAWKVYHRPEVTRVAG